VPGTPERFIVGHNADGPFRWIPTFAVASRSSYCMGWFMFRPSGSVLVVTAVSLAAGLFVAPGVARAADTTTHLSKAQMAAALKMVAGTSTAAAHDGWKATIATTGSLSESAAYVVDPLHGIAFDQLQVAFAGVHASATHYAVAGTGLYANLEGATSRAAVKMIGRPAVRYVFTPRRSLNLAAYVKENALPPAVVLTEDVAHAGTKTLHDDGSADYTLHDADDVTVTMRVSPAGTLSGAHATSADFTSRLTYAYGKQTVTLPAAGITISSATLTQAVGYVSMPARVKNVARQGAAHARRAAHGRTVKVTALRKVVRRDVAKASTHQKMIKLKDIHGGVRVYATNPWTHQTVSYTVKASGKNVVVKS
jgi:hypothetical protein